MTNKGFLELTAATVFGLVALAASAVGVLLGSVAVQRGPAYAPQAQYQISGGAFFPSGYTLTYLIEPETASYSRTYTISGQLCRGSGAGSQQRVSFGWVRTSSTDPNSLVEGSYQYSSEESFLPGRCKKFGPGEEMTPLTVRLKDSFTCPKTAGVTLFFKNYAGGREDGPTITFGSATCPTATNTPIPTSTPQPQCATSCDDDNPCTVNTCDNGTCRNPNLANGTACNISGSTGICKNGLCCTGCWDGASCRSGNTDIVCGENGQACIDCTLAGKICSSSGECVLPPVSSPTPHATSTPIPYTCGPENCNGCCSTVSNACVSGTSNTSCGSGGVTCQNCITQGLVCDSVNRVCVTSAYPQPTPPTATKPPDTSLPDLTIEEVKFAGGVSANPKEGDAIEFEVTESNIGQKEAPSHWLNLYLNGSFLGQQSLGMLRWNERRTVKFGPWNASAGQYTLKAVVDPGKLIQESNENNNEKTFAFTITSVPVANAISVSASVIYSTPGEVDLLRFFIKKSGEVAPLATYTVPEMPVSGKNYTYSFENLQSNQQYNVWAEARKDEQIVGQREMISCTGTSGSQGNQPACTKMSPGGTAVFKITLVSILTPTPPACDNLNMITTCDDCMRCKNTQVPSAVWCENIQGNSDWDSCVEHEPTCRQNNGTPRTSCGATPPAEAAPVPPMDTDLDGSGTTNTLDWDVLISGWQAGTYNAANASAFLRNWADQSQ